VVFAFISLSAGLSQDTVHKGILQKDKSEGAAQRTEKPAMFTIAHNVVLSATSAS